MKPRTTLALALLAAAIFTFIRFYDSKVPPTREAAERNQRVVNFDREKIDEIAISNSETRITFRKRGQQWMIETPVKDRADPASVDQLLTSVEMLPKEQTLEGKNTDSVKDLGLGKPALRLKLGGPGAPPEILLGKDAAVEGKLYVRLDNSDKIFVTSSDLRNQLTKKADDFRDRKLSDLNATQVKKVVIKNAGGEIEIQKKQGHWQLTKPLNARGDDQKIADTIAQLVNTRIDTFVTGETEKSGLNESHGTVTISAEGSGKPSIFEFGSTVDGGKIYARLSSRDAVYLLPKTAGDILTLKPNVLRDKSLLRLDPDIVDRINIETTGEHEKIILARKQENWILAPSNLPANRAQVTKMISDLQNQKVTAFVSDVASELAKYGLDHPALKVTFSSFASENTAESASGEKPILSLSFGKIEGDNIYARLEDESFIVSVPKGILDSLPTDPVQWHDLAIYNFKPDEISAVEMTRAGQPTIEITRADKGWKLTKGEGAVEPTNAQAIVNTLSNLHAVRWTGQKVDAATFANPAVNVTFTAKGKANTLIVGAATNERMWNATSRELPGMFLVSKPDMEALQLPVAIKQSAPPVPSATPSGSPSPEASASNP
jgi:hypothetical protein